MDHINPKLANQPISFNENYMKFCNNSKMMLLGPSGIGKSGNIIRSIVKLNYVLLSQFKITEFLITLLSKQETYFESRFEHIVIFIPSGSSQLMQDNLEKYKSVVPDIIIHDGLPQQDLDELGIDFKSGPSMFIFEDNWLEATESKFIAKLTTLTSRKLEIFLCFVSQNCFSNNKFCNTLRRNISYYVIWHSFHTSYIKLLSNNLFSEKNFLINAFREICKYKRNHWEQFCIVNLNPRYKLSDNLRCYTNIFEKEIWFLCSNRNK